MCTYDLHIIIFDAIISDCTNYVVYRLSQHNVYLRKTLVKQILKIILRLSVNFLLQGGISFLVKRSPAGVLPLERRLMAFTVSCWVGGAARDSLTSTWGRPDDGVIANGRGCVQHADDVVSPSPQNLCLFFLIMVILSALKRRDYMWV